MAKSIPQVAMLIAIELETHHASLDLTRIVVALDPLHAGTDDRWYRIAIGQGTIGVTDGVPESELWNAEDISDFVDRIVARLYDALERAHIPATVAALPDVQ